MFLSTALMMGDKVQCSIAPPEKGVKLKWSKGRGFKSLCVEQAAQAKRCAACSTQRLLKPLDLHWGCCKVGNTKRPDKDNHGFTAQHRRSYQTTPCRRPPLLN